MAIVDKVLYTTCMRSDAQGVIGWSTLKLPSFLNLDLGEYIVC